MEMNDPLFDCPSLNSITRDGGLMLQNLPSVLCGHALELEEGDVVLDMCAAPGIFRSHISCLQCVVTFNLVFATKQEARRPIWRRWWESLVR